MRKFFNIFLISLMVFSLFAGFDFETAKADPITDLWTWYDGNYSYRTFIEVKADRFIDEDITDYPVYINLNVNSTYWDYCGSDGSTDLIIVGLDEGIATTLSYEVINYNASSHNYEIFFLAPLLNGASGITESNFEKFAIYYNNAGSDGKDDPTGVWGATAKYIGHFVNNANDSSSNANHGTVTDAVLESNSSYLGGSYYVFDGNNDKITLLQGLLGGLSAVTIVTEVYVDPTCANNGRIFDYGTSPWESGVYSISYLTSGTKLSATGYDTTYRSANTGAITSRSIFASVFEINSKNYVFLNSVKTAGSVINATLSNNEITQIGLISDNSGDFKGKIGFMWVFSDVKSDDWIKANYNNLENYSNFIEFSEGKPSEVPTVTIPNETEFYNMSFLDEDPDFNWTFLDDLEYDLQINTSDYWDGALVYDESGITETETVTTLENYTRYYARARGFNDVNASYYTAWSDVKTFKTAFPPVITSPLDSAVISNNLNVPIEFIYDASGWIEISDDNFVTVDYNNTFWLDDDIPLLENNKEYKIRVKSLVEGYLMGSPSYRTNWSDIITITTNLKPVVVFPVDSAIYDLSDDLQIDFQPLGTVLGGNFLYDIEVANDDAFTDMEYNFTQVDYEPDLTGLLEAGTYCLRVRGKETVDLYYSNWSDTIEFTITNDICDEDLYFLYPTYNGTFVTASAYLQWTSIAGVNHYEVKLADNALMTDAVTFSVPSGYTSLNFELEDGTYYVDLRVQYTDLSYSGWLSDCTALHKFNVQISEIAIPEWITPTETYFNEFEEIGFSWTDCNGSPYWIQFYDNPTFDPDDIDDPALVTQRIPDTEYIQLNFYAGFYWAVIKTQIGDDYSAWSETLHFVVLKDGEIPDFDPEDVPTWVTPTDVYLESGIVNYSWSAIDGATGYDIQISTSPTFATYVVNTSTVNPSYTATLSTSDEYYTRVRAKDAYYNGAWSETKYFELVIEEVEYIYIMNTVNLYGGDTLLYEFSGMTPFTTYTFKINSLDEDGQFFQNVATKIVNSDGDGEASFTHVFSGSAFYPFEVRDNSNNYRLLTHFVAPRPTHLYLNADHRLDVNGTIISVAVGDVAYNTQSGILHDPYQPTQSLYQYGDYLLIHYSIPDPEDAIYGIVIKNIATGANVGIIASDDLYTFNRELGYAKRNFIVVSTNGIKPYIIDQYAELAEYTGDDWHYFNFDKGAYDYALLELDGDNTVIGESVILIGDDNIAEWALTVASATVEENSNQTFNFTVNTSEIWDAYNYMYFLDKSSGLFKIGSSSAYVKHPFSYQSSFTLTYPVTTELYDDGAGRWGIKPFRYNFNADIYEDVYYEYILEKSFIITPITDATDAIGSFLTLVGLGTPEGKLLFSLVGVIIGMVAVVLLGVPVGLAGLIGLIILAIFTVLGFVPIWTIIIIGLGLFLLLLRTFLSGGGGE